MTLEIAIRPEKAVRKRVVARVEPGHYATITDFSSGRPKNISVHVTSNDRIATVHEFPDGTYTDIRLPHIIEIPLSRYSKRNLDAILRTGNHYEHPIKSKSRAAGTLILTHLPPRRAARSSLAGRHH